MLRFAKHSYILSIALRERLYVFVLIISRYSNNDREDMHTPETCHLLLDKCGVPLNIRH